MNSNYQSTYLRCSFTQIPDFEDDSPSGCGRSISRLLSLVPSITTMFKYVTIKGWFNSVTIYIFEKYWLLVFVFQGRQSSDKITFEGSGSSASGPLVQGKFTNYCIDYYCPKKQILNRQLSSRWPKKFRNISNCQFTKVIK